MTVFKDSGPRADGRLSDVMMTRWSGVASVSDITVMEMDG